MTTIRRRAYQIMDSGRAPALHEIAARLASRATFNEDPDGAIGGLGTALRALFSHWALSWTPLPRLMSVPFVKVPFNAFSQMADLTPVGIIRGAKGSHLVQKPGEKTKFDSAERFERLFWGTVGTSLAAALVHAFMPGDDEEENPPLIQFTARGPKSLTTRNALRERNNYTQFAVGVGRGKDTKWYKFAETALALPLTIAGAVHDSVRYGKLEPKTGLEATEYILGNVKEAMLNIGPLRNVGTMLDGDFAKASARNMSGFIPMKGLLASITATVDPELTKNTNWLAMFLDDVPFVRVPGTETQYTFFGEKRGREGLERIPIVRRFAAGQTTAPTKEAAWLADRPWLNITLLENDHQIPIALTRPTKAEKERKNQLVQERTARMGVHQAGFLTVEEFDAYARKSGEYMRDVVRQMMTLEENGSWDDHKAMNRTWEGKVTAYRKRAKMEAVGY